MGVVLHDIQQRRAVNYTKLSGRDAAASVEMND
jgi:hypothetical protein